MKAANNLLFWVIGLPMVAVIWIAMVGPETGLMTLGFMLFSLGTVFLIRKLSGHQSKE